MKIVLDLTYSINNYDWTDADKLKEHIENNIKPILWELYDDENISVEERNRLYDLLDMFNIYEIESKGDNNE